MPQLTLPEFVTRWKAVTLSERFAYQQHFLDLCDLLGQKSPAEVDPSGASYTYNQRPQWLQDAHRILDDAVLNAYGWPTYLSNEDILQRLLALNHERAKGQVSSKI